MKHFTRYHCLAAPQNRLLYVQNQLKLANETALIWLLILENLLIQPTLVIEGDECEISNYCIIAVMHHHHFFFHQLSANVKPRLIKQIAPSVRKKIISMASINIAKACLVTWRSTAHRLGFFQLFCFIYSFVLINTKLKFAHI